MPTFAFARQDYTNLTHYNFAIENSGDVDFINTNKPHSVVVGSYVWLKRLTSTPVKTFNFWNSEGVPTGEYSNQLSQLEFLKVTSSANSTVRYLALAKITDDPFRDLRVVPQLSLGPDTPTTHSSASPLWNHLSALNYQYRRYGSRDYDTKDLLGKEFACTQRCEPTVIAPTPTPTPTPPQPVPEVGPSPILGLFLVVGLVMMRRRRRKLTQ